ncbi:F0F1 ATP synthase subunit B [Streptomyces sp. NPDC004111]|uniref:F0F1 ATP synthase subunit B n=1 Tax=Streptomyces sp. NPDC004111 TaxID=3364690 RepID=UPI0036C4E060
MDVLIPELAPMLVCLVAFTAVFVPLATVLLPRINKVLADRHDALDGDIARAERMKIEAYQVLAMYRAALAKARHEAAQVRQQALEEGAQLLAEIRAEGLRERELMIAEAQAQLAAARIIAETELRGDVVSLATELAGRVVGEPVHEIAENSDVVDRFFSSLDPLKSGLARGSS